MQSTEDEVEINTGATLLTSVYISYIGPNESHNGISHNESLDKEDKE